MPLPAAGMEDLPHDLALDFGGKFFEFQFQRDVIALQAVADKPCRSRLQAGMARRSLDPPASKWASTRKTSRC